MSDKELDRLDIIKKISNKQMTHKEAANLLTITTRQTKRLLKQFRELGADGLVSQHRGKKSNRKFTEEFKAKVVAIVQKNYSDFGPTLAAEKLLERDKIKLNKETLRQWMVEFGLWKSKKQKTICVHQQRARRSCLGELVQIDGSPHAWFENRGPSCCLLVFVDDSTGRVMELEFTPTESTESYFKATRRYIKKHGRPIAYYCDKHAVFHINHSEALSGKGETQFGRAMRELNIKLVYARSPQAKGRVERMNGILQDRLVKELRLENISSITDANKFASQFIKKYNKQFAKLPASEINMHRRELPTEKTLDLIFSFQETRILSKNLELSYHNVTYQIKTDGRGYAMRGATVTICKDLKSNVHLLYKNKELTYKIFDKQNQPGEAKSSKELDKLIDDMTRRSLHFDQQAKKVWNKKYALTSTHASV